MREAIYDCDSGLRFKQNRIVRYLLEMGPHDMNDVVRLANIDFFTRDELKEFYQLIGYSLNDYVEIFEDDVEVVDELEERFGEKEGT